MTLGGDVAFNKEVLQQLIHNDWRIIDTKRSWQCFSCSESHLTATQKSEARNWSCVFDQVHTSVDTVLACVSKSL